MDLISNDKYWFKCEHCGRLRPTKDECWDLHGRPHISFLVLFNEVDLVVVVVEVELVPVDLMLIQ